MAHVETWAFDDGCNGGAGARAPLVRRWLTFAESNCGPRDRKVRRDCHSRHKVHCYAMQYLDTDWSYPDESGRHLGRVASESWWLHAPAAKGAGRIYSSSYGGGYLINQFNPAVQSFFRSYVRARYNSDDGLMMDWQAPSLSQQLYYATCGCSSTSEIRSNAALRRGHEQMSAALIHRHGTPFLQAQNSLPPNPYLPQGLDMLNHSTGVVGLIAEGEPESDGTLDPFYSTLLDQIAYVSHRRNAFIVPLSHGAAGAPYQVQSRQVQEATVLLGYTRRHIVDAASLEEGSRNLAVWPEEGIVPTHPLQTMRAPRGRGCLAGRGRVCRRGGHNNVRVAPGVYRREFSSCYLRGHSFGACAAVVNTTGHTITIRASWLRIPLHHQITFEGGDVQSGGILALGAAGFTAGSAQLGPHDAVLLAP